jgi:hypothetical protein
MGAASHDLMRLRPATSRYKQPFADGSKPIHYGLIAEELAEVRVGNRLDRDVTLDPDASARRQLRERQV